MKSTDQAIGMLTNISKCQENKPLKLQLVNQVCLGLELNESEISNVIGKLEEKSLVQVPKGFASMSNLQKMIHRFINDELLDQLLKNGKAQLVVSEEDLKSLTTERVNNVEKCYVLNKKGDLIKPSCNNTNITQARLVAKTRENAEKLEK